MGFGEFVLGLSKRLVDQRVQVAKQASRPGHKVKNPMAVVILGGLFTSTVLNLLSIPVLYWMFAKPES